MEFDVAILRQDMERARAIRMNEESEWDSISRLIVGRDKGWKHKTQDTGDFTNQGRTVRNYNSSPSVYQRQLSAALHVMLTNPAFRWFRLATEDDAPDEVKRHAYEATSKTLDYLSSPESMFPTAVDEIYMDLASYGTGCMYARPPKGDKSRMSGDLVRFKSVPIGALAVLENDECEVEQVFHDFKMTKGEIRRRWKDADLSELQGKKDNDEVELTHAVFPAVYIDGKAGPEGMRWHSVYLLRDGKSVIVKRRMRWNPYTIVRWRKHSGAVWGDGPGHMALAAVRTAAAIKKTQLAAGSLATFPPISVYANSTEGPLRWMPGAINYMRASARERPEAMTTGADPSMGAALLEQELALIREAFFIPLLMLPDRDRMTATEVNEHRLQKLETFSPIVSRLYAELLTPVVMMTFQTMMEAGMIPQAPESAGNEFRLDFRGPLSQSQRASAGDSFLRFMMQSGPLVQINPDVMGNLDSDATFRELGDINDINPNLFREMHEVRQERQARAEQEQAMMQQQAITGAAGAFKDAASGVRDLGQAG